MKSRSCKNKGVRLQNFVKNAILNTFPVLHDDDVKTAIMGESGEDIHLSPAARLRFPFSVECKNVERLNVWEAFAQASKNSGAYVPILVMKKNLRDPLVVIPLDEFMLLTKECALNSDVS